MGRLTYFWRDGQFCAVDDTTAQWSVPVFGGDRAEIAQILAGDRYVVHRTDEPYEPLAAWERELLDQQARADAWSKWFKRHDGGRHPGAAKTLAAAGVSVPDEAES